MGLIGASGKWSNKIFIPAIISAKNAEIIAICGRSFDIQNEFPKNIVFLNFTQTYMIFYITQILILFWIASCDDLHYEHALACLAAVNIY